MELKICHMYPDILNLYGDRGNVMCMSRRLRWRGIDVSVEKLPLGEQRSLAGFDLIFIGGGQDFDRELLLDDLNRGKAREVRAAAEDGITFLTVCGGFQLMGSYLELPGGEKLGLIGAVDMYTVAADGRFTGNYKFTCTPGAGGSTVVGFENHSGRTYLGNGTEPLGIISCGHGNNGSDSSEGVHYKNVFGTYSHGPVLPKNPRLCDFILQTALERRYGSAELSALDDSAELAAHDEMCSKL